MRAIYGCTAHHWGYATLGLSSLGLDVDLMRPYEAPPRLLKALQTPGVPQILRSLANRRANAARSPGRALGVGEFVLPAFIHTGTPIRPAVRRTALDLQARRFARQAHGTSDLSVVQFTDGLGHRLKRDRLHGPSVIICERRNLHHASFTVDLDPCLDLPYQPLQADPIEAFLDQEYATADLIQVYSKYAAQTFVDHGVEPEKLLVAPLPAPIARPVALDRDVARDGFLFVGRVEAVKGIDLAVAATRKAGCKLMVAGPATEEMQRWLAEFDHVTYLGVADRGQLNHLMTTCLALVMPSFESYGLVLLEAAAAGLPVVAGTTVGAAEYLGLRDLGLEVSSRDPDEWAEVLTFVADESSEWRGHVRDKLLVALDDLDEESCSRHYSEALLAALTPLGIDFS